MSRFPFLTNQRATPGRRSRWWLAPVCASVFFCGRGAAQYQNDGSIFSRDPMYVAPKGIFFPPSPPPLDRAISHVALPAPRRLAPPLELAAYVNEPFYAPLSTWLAEQTLNAKLRQRLDAYRAAKLTAQRELRTVLEQLRDADPAARRAALEAFARQQAPRVAALEQTAEQLRADLAISNYDWRALREWSLDEKNTRGDSPFEIASVMRAYAYYQNNLAAGQRRLLREIAMELSMAGEDAAAAQAAQPFMFFSPEPARVLLPEDLPSDVAANVAAYQTRKSALKKELYDTVYKEDGATFGFQRQSALRSLADKQARRLAELEALAEEIRRGLALLPPTAQRPAERSPLPVALTERIGTLLQTRTTLQRETIAKVEAIRERHASLPAQVSYGFENDSLKFIVVPRRMPGGSRMTEEMTQQIATLQAEMAAAAEEFGRRYADFVNETEVVRRDATQALPGANARAVENAIAAATRGAALRETEDAYRDYRTAVFEPGLSPEQRRLLFDGAIEKLDVPLPRGEFQPTQRAASW